MLVWNYKSFRIDLVSNSTVFLKVWELNLHGVSHSLCSQQTNKLQNPVGNGCFVHYIRAPNIYNILHTFSCILFSRSLLMFFFLFNILGDITSIKNYRSSKRSFGTPEEKLLRRSRQLCRSSYLVFSICSCWVTVSPNSSPVFWSVVTSIIKANSLLLRVVIITFKCPTRIALDIYLTTKLVRILVLLFSFLLQWDTILGISYVLHFNFLIRLLRTLNCIAIWV